MGELVFLKLGGSLITDKRVEFKLRGDALRRVADEIAVACTARPELRLLLGHGSGSFGHVVGQHYGTRQGVQGPEAWHGFAAVAVAAAQLNRSVTDALWQAGLPVLSLAPSASARCHDGRIVDLAIEPFQAALDHKLIPLTFGDVAFDDMRGGTIVSTEDVFGYLATRLAPARILLAGEVDGVFGISEGEIIPHIGPDNLEQVRASLSGSHGVDVTGGMWTKVNEMAALAASQPGLSVRIFSARHPGLLTEVLVDPHRQTGTVIYA